VRTIMNLEVGDANRVDAAFAVGRLFGPDAKIETKTVSYPDPEGALVEVQTMIIDGQLPGELLRQGRGLHPGRDVQAGLRRPCTCPTPTAGYLVGPRPAPGAISTRTSS